MSSRSNRRRGRQPRKKTSSVQHSLKTLSRVVPFRFAVVGGLSSDSKGVAALAVPADPSSQFSEWTSLITLYTSFRVRALRVQIVPVMGLTQGFALAVAGSMSSLSTPTSYSTIAENADSTLIYLGQTGVRGYTHKLPLRGNIEFANTGTPVPGDYAGAPGAIQMYGEGFAVSITVASILVEGFYEFRSRS